MGIKINYNASAILANNALNINDNKLSASLERLSSGYKINRAKDNASGLAISRRMNAQIKGLKTAEQDAKDGVSVIEIADGALAEVHDILQRMNELSVKSSNGTMTDEDRKHIQEEVESLADEIDRIGESTEYNGQKLFNGRFDLKGYTNKVDVKVDTYSDTMDTGKYIINSSSIFFIEKDGELSVADVDDLTDSNADNKVSITKSNGQTVDYSVSGDGYHLKFTGDSGDEFVLDISKLEKTDEIYSGITYKKISVNDLELNLTGYGAMTFQVGANEGQTVDVRFQKLSLESLGFKNQDSDSLGEMILNVSTKEGAVKGINQVSSAISQISSMRSRLGASQNRLEHTLTNLSTSSDNVTAAYSRIMDTDMAEEMTNYSNLQIVSQAATAILAQTNERPSQMLQLLQ